jgi:hypothetical protein
VRSFFLLFFLWFALASKGLVAQDTIPDYFPTKEEKTLKPINRTAQSGKEVRVFRMVHKTNPFAMLIGNTPYNSELRYMNETVVYKQLSLVLSGSYLFKGPMVSLIERADSNKLNGVPKLSLNGFRFQLALRFYPVSRVKAPKGFWLGPHFSILNFKIKPQNSSLSDAIDVTHWNINMLVGYQFIAGRVCFDLYAGIGYKRNDWYYVDSSGKTRMNEVYLAYPYYSFPIKLNFGANFGLAF